ncbi:MFS transporter [Candidatus Dojkabacteria bacterium]|uniref:MFS transporter n=1 Tax=Candidatus Dojkabacteria bacterium TaxID=2099670 RepID=A0A955L7E3_9BACT|nr:MFS transporter [Candidatus Dojkabacteria bacterium]
MQHFQLNSSLRILLATNSLILLAGAMLAPIYALFVEDIGGSLMDASIAGGIFALFAGVTTFISGKISDSFKENELIIVLGYVIVGIGFLSYLWANSIVALFIIQALIGIGEAIYSPAFDAVYSKHLDTKSAGTQWGAWESMNYFTSAIGAIVGGSIVTIFGFNTLFICMFALCITSGLYIYHLKRSVL